MKLTVLQENLSKALSIVSRSVASRAQLPVLSNILLATDRGRLKLTATNLETGVNYWLGAKVEKEGTLSVPAKIFTEFITSLPPEKVNLKVQESNLQVLCSSHQASFIGLNASEFPAVPTLKGRPGVTFNSHDLATAISQVAFAAAQDEGNPVLTGVLFLVKDDNLLLVATDGYRLSLKRIGELKGISKIEEFKKGLLLPAKTLLEVGRIVGEGDQEKSLGLAVTPKANQVIFVTPESEVTSRLIEGEFPDFEKILPGKGKTKATVETADLLRAVKIASIFARESANIVKFNLDKGGLILSANTAQVGENSSQVEAKIEGGKNQIAFNSRYLLDFLNSVQADSINLEVSGPLNPGVFLPADDKSYTHIIMPVRVQE